MSDFRDVVCSLFPKAILFEFYYIQTSTVQLTLSTLRSKTYNNANIAVSSGSTPFAILFLSFKLNPYWHQFALQKSRTEYYTSETRDLKG